LGALVEEVSMREALAVDCPACEPDPVLLEQLTALASASTTPATKPWWHRFTLKPGAAVISGALLVSGAAAADAEHARSKPAPVVATVVAAPKAAQHHPAPTFVTLSHPSFVVYRAATPRIRHAGARGHHRQHVHHKKHQDGNRNRDGSGNSQVDVQADRLLTLAPQAAASSLAPDLSTPGQGQRHQQSHSQH